MIVSSGSSPAVDRVHLTANSLPNDLFKELTFARRHESNASLSVKATQRIGLEANQAFKKLCQLPEDIRKILPQKRTFFKNPIEQNYVELQLLHNQELDYLLAGISSHLERNRYSKTQVVSFTIDVNVSPIMLRGQIVSVLRQLHQNSAIKPILAVIEFTGNSTKLNNAVKCWQLASRHIQEKYQSCKRELRSCCIVVINLPEPFTIEPKESFEYLVKLPKLMTTSERLKFLADLGEVDLSLANKLAKEDIYYRTDLLNLYRICRDL